MNKILGLLGLVLASAPLGGAAAQAGAAAELPAPLRPQARATSGDWWNRRFQEKLREIAALPDRKVDVVLFGDSITHFWETTGKAALADLRRTYSVLDIGYSSDGTQHLLWRGENGELDGYRAKCVVLMIGTNNWPDEPKDVAEGIRRILALVARKQPQAKVVLLPIFPRGASAGDARRLKNDRVNELIRPLADGRQVFWLDIAARFLDAQGDTKWVMPDRLHPNAHGYAQIWLPALKPVLSEACR